MKNKPKAPNESVVAYMRYSSRNQDEESIKYQRDAIGIYAFRQGYLIEKEYIDEARTGTNDRRPAFQQMLADAQNNPPWHKILVYDMSRFSRNNNDATRYTADLEDIGIEIVSVTQQFDNSGEGALMRGVVNLLNEYYSKNLAKHTHAGLKQKATDGKHCGGKPPLGYNVNEAGYLEIDQHEAMIVQLIFNLFEANYSYRRIADELNSRGYKTKAGNHFNKNSFASILAQEKYIGVYRWNKSTKKNNKGIRNSHKYKPEEDQIIKEDSIPPIISKEQFERVQEKLKKRRGGSAESKSRHFYLLSGIDILKCADCGANLIGTKRKSHGREYTYYFCPNHKKHACPTKELRADYLDKFVIKTLVRDMYERDDFVKIYNNTNGYEELKEYKKLLKKREAESRNILKALRQESNEELLNELKKISEEKRLLQTHIDNISNEEKAISEKDRKRTCKAIAKIMINSESYDVKKYISEIVDEIIVSNDEITLSLNIN